MIGTCPYRKEMVKTPRKIVATVRVDSLKETQTDPKVNSDNVQMAVSGAGTVQYWSANSTQPKDHDFYW